MTYGAGYDVPMTSGPRVCDSMAFGPRLSEPITFGARYDVPMTSGPRVCDSITFGARLSEPMTPVTALLASVGLP